MRRNVKPNFCMSRKGDLDDNHVRRHGLVTFKAAMERGVHSALSMA